MIVLDCVFYTQYFSKTQNNAEIKTGLIHTLLITGITPYFSIKKYPRKNRDIKNFFI
jgi:hypothetical protein